VCGVGSIKKEIGVVETDQLGRKTMSIIWGFDSS
jgi:hypothetical protein